MPLDTRIALGVQPLQVADPLAQYGQVQNILAAQSQRQAAGTSNELAQVQLGQARMTLQQAQEAQDTVAQIMGTIGQHGGPTDPMEAAILMLKNPRKQVQDVGGHLLDSHQKVLAYQQQAQFLKDQSPDATAAQPEAAAPAAFQYEESPAFGAQARTAPVDSSPATSMPVVRGMQTNALASATPTTASVNALVAPERTAQSLAAEIKQKDRQYGNAPGWLKNRELLIDEYKQLIKPEFEFREIPNADGTISYQAINKRTAQAQPVMNATNQPVTGPNVPAQKLAFDKEVEQYKRDNPGKTVHTIINDDGTTSMLAVNNKTGVAEKVTLGGVEVKGIDTAAQRLMWEQDHPNKEIKEVSNADGTTKLMAVDKQAGTATPITSEGKPLVGAKYVTPTEEEKLIKLRDSLPKGSADYNAVNAKINQAAEQNRIAKANLANATTRLKEEMAGDKINPATIDLVANLYLQTGTFPPLGMGTKAATARSQILNRAAELSGNTGVTPAQAATNIVQGKQDVAGQTAAVKDFSSGMSARRVTANNTAINHLETLDKLATDLNNSDIRIVNAAGNAFARATGSAAPTNFDSAKQLVAAEVIKAVVQNGGGVTERQEAADNIKSASSPEQLRQIIQTYRELLGGQLTSLAQQYETGTGRKDFDKKLSPATRDLLKRSTPAPAAPPAGAGGFKYLGKE